MVMFKSGRIKTNADYVKDVLAEAAEKKKQEQWDRDGIDLYPENLAENNMLFKIQDKKKAASKLSEDVFKFQEDVKKELLFHSIYEGILESVCESMAMTSHQREVIANTIVDFINEQDIEDLLDKFKYQNLYLAEFARLINEKSDVILESAKDKIKEGLPEKDAFQIENDKINDYILNAKGVVPDNFCNCVYDRVEDAVNNFIDDNRKNKSDIKKIYDDAREKVMASDGDQEIQQEALRMAKKKEADITNRSTNVFGEMVKIMTESVHRIEPIRESYTNKTTNKIDFGKLVGDVKAIYTFMEAMNTCGIIDVDSQFITETLQNLREDMDRVSQDDSYIPAGENVMPKEKDQDPADDNDNNPADDFPANTGDSEGQDPNGATFSDTNTSRDFDDIQ